MDFNLFKPKKYVGIDIGHQFIKLAVLEKGKDGVHIKELTEIKTPTNLYSSNFSIKDEEFAQQMGEFVDKHQLKKGCRVITSVGGKNAIVRSIKLPNIPDKELLQAVLWELTKYINLDPEKMVVDFTVLSRTKEQLDILVFACKDELLTNLYNFLSHFDLAPKEIDLEVMSLCYLRAFAKQQKVKEFKDGSWMSIDMGDAKTTIGIFDNDILSFVHTINTTLANSNNDFSYMVYDEISREILRIVDYYQIQLKRGKIDHIFISGGHANQKAIEMLQTRINISLDRFPIEDIFTKVKLPQKVTETPNQYVTAIGMAVREVV